MRHNPTHVRVNHENTGRQATGSVSFNQRSVIEDSRAHSETGNEAKRTRHSSICHCEADFSARIRVDWVRSSRAQRELLLRVQAVKQLPEFVGSNAIEDPSRAHI